MCNFEKSPGSVDNEEEMDTGASNQIMLQQQPYDPNTRPVTQKQSIGVWLSGSFVFPLAV